MALSMNRRTFLHRSVAGTVGAGFSTHFPLNIDAAEQTPIPTRMLGKTQEHVTIIGMPGWHVGRMKDEKAAERMIRMSLDLGITFYDSAYSYSKGESERRLGRYLGRDRKRIFLMTKSTQRSAKDSEKEIHESLKRLQTDYLDLWQFHSLKEEADIDKIFAPGGAMETAQKALDAGIIRHLGFTGHYNPTVLYKMIREYHDQLETVQMPINPLDPHYLSFIKIVIPIAVQHNLGIIAMKTVANGIIVEENICTADECHRFAWSQDGVSTLVCGMDTPDQLQKNIAAAQQFKPYTPRESDRLLAETAPYGGPHNEFFKVGGTTWRTFPKNPIL